uniref:Uncharacterized protein n=1 Tax=Glycine max TaxID=3847 RepID=A0A0R0KYW9_SOYBN
MKTISGHCVPVKDISVSKAAQILTKFVSADNAFASFNELKHLHKELGSSDSHKKHKRHRTENGNDSGKFKRQQSGSGNADGENFNQQQEEENVDGVKCIRRRKRRSRKLSPCTT